VLHKPSHYKSFPPKVCRLLARKNHGLVSMSADEIAAKAGLAVSTVAKISRLPDWSTVKTSTMEKFAFGCGVNLDNPADQIKFWRRRNASYMKTANPMQRIMYRRILKEISECAPQAR